MRAREFVTEGKKMHPYQEYPIPGGFGGVDKYYQLYRMGVLMASAPGFDEVDSDVSWIGDHMFIGTYTDADYAKMQAAFKKFGVTPTTHTDTGSREPPGGNIQSIARPFAGYPR